MRKKKAIVSVINDLATDQRVDKTARVLLDLGFEVVMVGRHKHDSMKMPERPYETHRMRLLWEKGPMFYIEYNIRLFFYLLANQSALLVSNDLDTLMPNFLISRMFRIPLVYDSHEYFTETPELIGRPVVQGIWKRIEKWIVPKLKDCITVNKSIAGLFHDLYGVDFYVVRNIPARKNYDEILSRKELGLPVDKKIALLQGAGINIQRGAEEAVEAMKYIEGVVLLIVGGGDVLPLLKKQVSNSGLEEKVMFIPKQVPDRLFSYTVNADIGLAIDKDTNINYRFSLPNKLFDYIHAGIPVLVSPLPEIKRVVEEYMVGDFIESHDPQYIASKISDMLSDENRILTWKQNLKLAAEALNWETEKQVLVEIFSKYA
jgi:glycosyltransferase involved in cell wall biosynthesis